VSSGKVHQYRKKPVVIEAVQWLGGNFVEVDEFLNDAGCKHSTFPSAGLVVIETPEGTMTAKQADWIIKGVAGECYPCGPVIFGETYEKVQ